MENGKRLIDANALFDELVKRQYSEQTMGIAVSFYPQMRGIVTKAPTVDAVEVVHGHWVITGGNQYTIFRRCSICCAMYDFTPNYCPNCGAKMDGGTDNV